MTPIDYNNPNEMWRHNGYDPYKGMSDEERIKAGCLQAVGIVGGIVAALLICALFGSCTTTKYVPVPEYHTDTLWQQRTLRDSIYIERHDSIVTFQKGDTVTIDRWHWRDRWRDRVKTDTIYRSRTDSIAVPYPVEVIKEVPADLTWWQQTRIHIGGIVFWLLLFSAAWYIGSLLRKVKNKFLP